MFLSGSSLHALQNSKHHYHLQVVTFHDTVKNFPLPIDDESAQLRPVIDNFISCWTVLLIGNHLLLVAVGMKRKGPQLAAGSNKRPAGAPQDRSRTRKPPPFIAVNKKITSARTSQVRQSAWSRMERT